MGYKYLGELKDAQIPNAIECEHVKLIRQIMEGEYVPKALEMQGLQINWDTIRQLEERCIDTPVSEFAE